MTVWNLISRPDGIADRNSPAAWTFAKRAFALLALGALVYFAWQSRGTLGQVIASAQPGWIVLSVVLWTLLHLISPWFTQCMLRARCLHLCYAAALKIHASRLPAKYLPGGIWHTVARAGDYHAHGLSPRRVAWYLLVENLVIAAVTLGLGGLITSTLTGITPGWKALAAASGAIGLLSLAGLPWMLARSPWRAVAFDSVADYFRGVIVMIVYWMTAAAAFASYVYSFQDLSLINSVIEIGGIYIFSWAIGFVTLIAPQGIGVAELIGSQLLHGNLGATGLIALLAGFRVIMIIGDLAMWLFSFLVSGPRTS